MKQILNRPYLFILALILLSSLACQAPEAGQPSASFLVDIDSGSAPLVVEFNNTSQGPATAVKWDFGDSTTSTKLSPVHRYTGAGTYDVKLSVSSPGGGDLSVMTKLITVEPGAVARVQVEPTEATMRIGESQSFSFSAFDQFDNQIFVVFSSWSAPPELGSIDAYGGFTAGSKSGDFPKVIRLELAKGTSTTSLRADVSIRPDHLATIQVEPSSAKVGKEGTARFTATGLDKYGNVIPDLAFLWRSNGGYIGQDGLFIAGDASGSYQVEVSATFDGNTATGSATVEPALAIPPPPGLVAWWPGDGTPDDIIGSNDGILMSGASFAPVLDGQAFSFDGSDDYVEILDSPSLMLDHNLTIALWIKPLSQTGSPGVTIIGNGIGCKTAGWRLDFFTTENSLIQFHGHWSWHVAHNSIVAENWYFVVGTVDESKARIYIDGELSQERKVDQTINVDTSIPIAIGANKGICDKYGNFYHGLIDEVAIFNRALTAAEIKVIYDAGSAGMIKPQPGAQTAP